MSRFQEALAFVLRVEGGYSDHAADRGGATNYGVTQRTYDQYRVRRNLPQQPVRFITKDEAEAIYKEGYWKPLSCDNLPAPLDLVVFDAAVNNGPKQAAKFLQRAVGVDDDGVIGRVTLGAVLEDDPASTAQNIIDQRRAFYRALVAEDESQRVFLAGWFNRLEHLSDAVEA